MRVIFHSTGSTDKMESFLSAMQRLQIRRLLEPLGKRGVEALAAATPKESGLAASSWSYQIRGSNEGVTIEWRNTNVESGFPVAIMLQYGYGTGTGGYVAGRDYINPAIRPVFDEIADRVWKVVTSA